MGMLNLFLFGAWLQINILMQENIQLDIILEYELARLNPIKFLCAV